MKSQNKLLFIIFCFWLTAQKPYSQGYIVTNGVTYGGYDSGTGFGYKISVVDNPSGASSIWAPSTQFWLNPASKTLPTIYTNTFSFQELTDVGVRVFLVSQNDAISLQPILSQSWTELSMTSSYVFQSESPFYVALYSGYNFAPPYPPNPPYNYLGPVFG